MAKHPLAKLNMIVYLNLANTAPLKVKTNTFLLTNRSKSNKKEFEPQRYKRTQRTEMKS
jgi:hypothetical protein